MASIGISTVNGFESEEDFDSFPKVSELSKPQRRVLGVLVEKAYTVPESYPLTVKSLISGSNQKSNRSPITNYTEDAILQAVEELRAMGLVAVVHTESGRTERFRHYVRKRFPFTEPQLAILTELLLRGRQQMGELRARASRMVPIESLQELKKEVEGLLSLGYVQVDGPLERRGVEIDHNFHMPGENAKMAYRSDSGSDEGASSSDDEDGNEETPRRESSPSSTAGSTAVSTQVTRELSALQDAHRELTAELEELRQQVVELKENLADLRRSLGA